MQRLTAILLLSVTLPGTMNTKKTFQSSIL